MSANFEVRDEAVEASLKDLGSLIGNNIPPGYGFTLMIFSYGKSGHLFYISSAQREDIIKVMKEFIEKEEKKHVS